MSEKKRAGVYMGRDGFRGISEVRRTSVIEKGYGPKKKPSVYIGSGGVNVRTVLANGGISRGGMVAMGGGVPSPRVVTKPKPEKRLEEFSKTMAEKEMEFVVEDAKAEKMGEAEVRRNMMEMAREPNLEALGGCAAVAVEGAEIEPQKNPPTMAEQPEVPKEESGEVPTVEVTMEELPKYTGFSKGEWGDGGVTLPELPLGGVPTEEECGKKRRKRKGRRNRSTEITEEERTEIQAAVEAASDAAANGQ